MTIQVIQVKPLIAVHIYIGDDDDDTGKIAVSKTVSKSVTTMTIQAK